MQEQDHGLSPGPHTQVLSEADLAVPDGRLRPSLEAAERELASLVAPHATASSPLTAAQQLFFAVLTSAAGAGLVLADPAIAAICGLFIAARLASFAFLTLWHRAQPQAVAGWTLAAEVHAGALPGRVPAATIAAAARYLPVMAAARRQARAWLYLAPCSGDGQCTVLCQGALIWSPGGQVMVVLGEHVADTPLAAAAALAHETGHQGTRAARLLAAGYFVRPVTGCGYALAALAGALAAGWPGAVIGAAAFHVLSLLVLWGGELACDMRAVRAEGRLTVLAGFDYMRTAMATRSAALPRPGRVMHFVLRWAAGPSHPPARLRRVVVTGLCLVRRPRRCKSTRT